MDANGIPDIFDAGVGQPDDPPEDFECELCHALQDKVTALDMDYEFCNECWEMK